MAAACAAALLAAPPALADAEKRREEGRILMTEAHVQVFAPVIAHCQSSTPDVREALAAGLANFRSAMAPAINRLVDAFIAQATPEELAEPISQAERQRHDQETERMSEAMLEKIRQLDVNQFCASLAHRLQKLTPESAWADVLKGPARIEADKRQRDARPR